MAAKKKAATSKRTSTKKAKGETPATETEPLVVFAFRLTQAERDLIHQTAGPRNATQFVRRVAVAFAQEDAKAFQGVLDEAKSARATQA